MYSCELRHLGYHYYDQVQAFSFPVCPTLEALYRANIDRGRRPDDGEDKRNVSGMRQRGDEILYTAGEERGRRQYCLLSLR